jgi:hypothetical protein
VKIFKLAIISFVFFFLLITVISLFLPSTIRITKTEEINTSKEAVMQQISDPAKWKEWYPGLDSAKLFYENGIVTGVVQNEKKQRLIRIIDKKEDEVMIEYKGSGKTKIAGGWKLSAVDSSITVQWYMISHLRWYPWEKFSGILYERSFSTQMKTGLIRLKDLLESK